MNSESYKFSIRHHLRSVLTSIFGCCCCCIDNMNATRPNSIKDIDTYEDQHQHPRPAVSEDNLSVAGSSMGGEASRVRLTVEEQSLILDSWRLSDSGNCYENSGQRIFKKIFQRKPEIRRVFGVEEEEVSADSDNRAAYSTPTYKHIRVFMNMLELAVSKAHNLPELTSLCHELGKRHAQLAVSHGFRPEYWTVFQEALIDAAIEWDTTDEVLHPDRKQHLAVAWGKLVEFMIVNMKEGYEVAMKQQMLNGNIDTRKQSKSSDERLTSGKRRGAAVMGT